MSDRPHYGFTRLGHAVHARTWDHLPRGSAVTRFNARLGVGVTNSVGTMWAAYAFAVLSLASLPAILTQAFHLHTFPSWLINASLIALVAWISSYFLQLVLLPIIIVGQNVQSQAADARAAKTFEDTEAVRADMTTALDRLDTATAGGIAEVLTAVSVLGARLTDQQRAVIRQAERHHEALAGALAAAAPAAEPVSPAPPEAPLVPAPGPEAERLPQRPVRPKGAPRGRAS